MEINSKEQAGCERNKGGHGRVMNNLDVEQPDLNTWVTTCMQVPLLWVLGIIKAHQWLPPHLCHSVYEQAGSVNTISFVFNNPREKCLTNKSWGEEVEGGMRVVDGACGTNELRRSEKRWPSMGLLFCYWMGVLGVYAWDKRLGAEIKTRDSRSFFLLWNYRLDILIIQMRVWPKNKHTLRVFVQGAWQ